MSISELQNAPSLNVVINNLTVRGTLTYNSSKNVENLNADFSGGAVMPVTINESLSGNIVTLTIQQTTTGAINNRGGIVIGPINSTYRPTSYVIAPIQVIDNGVILPSPGRCDIRPNGNIAIYPTSADNSNFTGGAGGTGFVGVNICYSIY